MQPIYSNLTVANSVSHFLETMGNQLVCYLRRCRISCIHSRWPVWGKIDGVPLTNARHPHRNPPNPHLNARKVTQAAITYCGWLRIPLRTAWKPRDTIARWYLQGNHHSTLYCKNLLMLKVLENNRALRGKTRFYEKHTNVRVLYGCCTGFVWLLHGLLKVKPGFRLENPVFGKQQAQNQVFRLHPLFIKVRGIEGRVSEVVQDFAHPQVAFREHRWPWVHGRQAHITQWNPAISNQTNQSSVFRGVPFSETNPYGHGSKACTPSEHPNPH